MLNSKRVIPFFKVRVFLVFGCFIFLFGLVIIRLFLLQILRESFFQKLALQQYNVEVTITPPRAQFFDRNGEALTFNRRVKSAFIVPTDLSEKEKTLSFLKKHYPKSYEQVIKNPKKHFIWVERKVSPQNLELIEKNKIVDIQYIEESQRFYPFANLSPVLGFTNIDNLGISGLELKYNSDLAGIPTLWKIEKDARAKKFYFTKMLEESGIVGRDLALTLDSKLQAFASQELKETIEASGAREGAVVIMNPSSGEILAMESYPYADPNEEIKSLDETKNRIVTECFEFGSVVKAFAALSALEAGVVTPDEIIDCEGKATYIDKFRVENWKSVGKLSFTEVIKNSSNVGVAKVAKRVGERLYDYYRKLGLGTSTGLKFPGERSGYVNSPDKWTRSSVIVMSFGYELNGTLLQIAKAFSIIANGGFDVSPSLILDKKSSKKDDKKERLFSEKAIAQLKNILQTIGDNYKIDGFRVMGKTGTARMLEGGHYSKTKHIYTFAGIVEKDDYKRVVVTFIKEPRKANLWASEIAAPLFQRIAEKMVLYEKLI